MFPLWPEERERRKHKEQDKSEEVFLDPKCKTTEASQEI